VIAVAIMAGLAATIEVSEPQFSRVWEPLTEAQRVAIRCTEPEVCYSGRRFGAKSNTGGAKAYFFGAMYPGAKMLLARGERASMNATTLTTLRDEIVPPAEWIGARGTGWQESKSDLVLRNGSVIHVRGLDDPERVLGLRVGLAVIDQAEQLTLEQFEITNSCVMQPKLPFCQTLCLFNPAPPEHWAFLRYRPDDGDGLRTDANGRVFARVIHVQPNDLLHLLSEESRARFDRMDGPLGQRLRWGKWVAAEGTVFDRWDASVHIVPPPPEFAAWNGYPPPDWRRRRAIDFGYEPDPYACVWITEAPDGRRFVYRQDMMTRLTIVEQAERIQKAQAAEMDALREAACAQGEDAVRNYASWLEDYQLQGSWSDHARGERAMLEDRGIITEPAEKDILAGLQTLRELLDPRFGPPRLRVIAGSLIERDQRLVEQKRPCSLEEEIPRLRYRTVREKGDSAAIRDVPLDKNNHAVDALRYCEHSHAMSGEIGLWL
jgi:hypothetical protein